MTSQDMQCPTIGGIQQQPPEQNGLRRVQNLSFDLGMAGAIGLLLSIIVGGYLYIGFGEEV